MKTRLVAIAFAAALGALAGASGCTVENRASVQTQDLCFPSQDCTFKETCDAQYIGYPILDQAATGGTLWLFLQVADQAPNNANLDVGRVNTNDAHIDETRVEYEGALSGTQSIGSNFRVPAGSTSVVSVAMDLSGATGGAGAATNEVVAHVRFRGYYDDGTRFESGDFPITIHVCATGCAPLVCPLGKAACPNEGQRPVACAQ